MDQIWKAAVGVLSTVAPMLATAVGGPLAGYSKERLQALDAQIVERMKRFNEAVQQAEKR